jgi:hypothetical protein
METVDEAVERLITDCSDLTPVILAIGIGIASASVGVKATEVGDCAFVAAEVICCIST